MKKSNLTEGAFPEQSSIYAENKIRQYELAEIISTSLVETKVTAALCEYRGHYNHFFAAQLRKYSRLDPSLINQALYQAIEKACREYRRLDRPLSACVYWNFRASMSRELHFLTSQERIKKKACSEELFDSPLLDRVDELLNQLIDQASDPFEYLLGFYSEDIQKTLKEVYENGTPLTELIGGSNVDYQRCRYHFLKRIRSIRRKLSLQFL